MGDGEYTLGGQTVYVTNGEARLEDGTLAGSVLTMRNTLSNLIHRFGIPPEKAVYAATAAPARAIRREDIGALAPGMWADFVILDENLDIVSTYVNGAVV